MSKDKKRKKQQNQNTPLAVPIPPGMAMQMLDALTGPRTQTLDDVLTFFESSSLIGTPRVTQNSRACCEDESRDAVIVAASTPEAIAKYQAIGADPDFRGLVIVGYDAHDGGRTLTVVLDAEDGKRLVNQLSEAIAELERLPAVR